MAAIGSLSNFQPSVANFQASSVLNSIVAQATGKTDITEVSTAGFISVATTAKGIATDALLDAITQVLSRTLFSIRPYSRKFKGLYMDSQRFGNHTRKLNIADSDWNKDLRYDLVDGNSVDDQIVKKPNVLQTNFYGHNIFERQVTIFKDQLNIALSSEEEFQRFITMVMTNASDQIEQAHESTARMTLANFIGGKVKGDADNVFKLVTLYNGVAGTELTATTVRQPSNFVPFMKWAVGFIKTVSDRMTERSQKFHINVTGKGISRHTPYNKQKLYLYSELLNDIDASVMTSIFNDEYLKFADHERVSYWQSINSPDSLKIRPTYIDSAGAEKYETTELAVNNIFGVLFDEEAVGITTFGEWSAPSPFNARGGYSNIFWHFNDRYFNDFTENGVVFLLQ